MKKVLYLFVAATLSLFMSSCSEHHHYIDAKYQYKGKINDHTYNIQLTLDKEGKAHLQMMDKPVIERLADYDLWDLYNDGLNGYYEYDKECDCYHIVPYSDYWYDETALHFVTSIYIGNDGYLYFSTKRFVYPEYKYSSGLQDAKTHTNKGPQYTKLQ